jgi:hypothetical protein
LTNEKKIQKLTIKDIILKGSVIAVLVATPSVFAFILSWIILDDLLQAVIIGAVVHFIAMGFSLKISKKLLVRND